MYKKSLIIIEDKRTAQYLKIFLRRNRRDVHDADALLSDVESIRNELYFTKNTSNLRKSFGQFIKNNGFPFLLIVDYTVDFGLTKAEDPDCRKLLRTFLIAFTILANAKGYDDAVANIILVCRKKDAPVVDVFRKNPLILLKQLKTNADRVNELIRTFIAEPERARRFFALHPLVKPADGNLLRMEQALEEIVADVEGRIEEIETPSPTPPSAPEMIEEDLEPADVICRVTIDRVFVNGEIRDLREDEKKRFQEKNILLDGAITIKTAMAVNERVLDLFNRMKKLNPFKKDERIFIRVPDSSLIDGSFASSVGSFLASSLGEYSGISIDMGPKNVDKIKNSNGFIAIKDYLIKNL
jgi:hypothetical protein